MPEKIMINVRVLVNFLIFLFEVCIPANASEKLAQILNKWIKRGMVGPDHFDADLDTDPTTNFDADPDPGLDPALELSTLRPGVDK